MYSAQTTNGLGTALTAGTGTINPAALNSSGLANPAIAQDNAVRGTKRSRSHSPDNYADIATSDTLGEDGDSKPRKRGRPTKPRGSGGVPESPTQAYMPNPQHLPPQTPQSQSTVLPNQAASIPVTPTQASPAKSTPSKSVIKALPTVRDHTTDQLGPEGDEYIPREYDEAGEKKVNPNGHLVEGRDYRCRTFFVPNRGDKLFMLATECARVLGYRDSYLLFNKNRSLYKIIATQAEKEDLISQEILPFSYRSRQIAIVTAKSMFRQFGSRVIVNGRRVRDDYWESKARKQGFTEEDLAGEKRPGAAKARDAAAHEASNNASLALGHHGDIVYSPGPGHPSFGNMAQPPVPPGVMGAPGNPPTFPMINVPDQNNPRDYSNIQRPRQEITGPPYQDRTQASPPGQLLQEAHNTAEYNKQINAQGTTNREYLQNRWNRPHEPPPPNIAPPAVSSDTLPTTQALQSPRPSTRDTPQTTVAQQPPQHMLAGQSYSQPSRQASSLAQAPMRLSQPSTQMHGRAPSLSLGSGSVSQSSGQYGYPQNQMWPPSQPQQSPQHSLPSYNHPQPSPHFQQSPHQPPPPQLRHQGSNPQMQPAFQYPGIQGVGQGYPAPGQGLYQQERGSQQFMQQTSAGPQPSTQGWAPPQQQQPGSGNWGWSGQ
ncbi:chromatin structure-remodeling complex protein rsc7 [Phlyctema vagabunda]|uniref:Chromatin structure-remodeling complex protein rsc7 n=1 Tax=Phlyctema vagabunda TaxID=108571 RepID=A0ABR4PXE0_9HELO